jgi:PAS domain S-box-containing protein
MILLKKIKTFVDQFLTNKIWMTVTISSLVPIMAWIIDFAISQAPFSFMNFIVRQIKNPALLILDFLPLASGLAVFYFEKAKISQVLHYRELIKRKEEEIKNNAEFAKNIGEGNYESDFSVFDEQDTLGRSLLLMRDNLLANYKKESAQSWIAEGKDMISSILRMHNNIEDLSYDVITNLINYIRVTQGAFYIYDEEEQKLKNLATYAYNRRKYVDQQFQIGEGLIGQCAYEMDFIYRTEIPDDYVTITSGILGDNKPTSILIIPLITNEKLQGIIEFAAVNELNELTIRFLREIGEIIARTVFNLKVNLRTEKLLREAQEMTRELQENEEQLRQNAEEMRATQEELEKSNEKLEAQIQAVENAQKRLHSLLENASEIITIYDKNLHITYVSPSATNILGFTTDEMMRGKDIERLTRKGEMEYKKMLETLMDEPDKPITIQFTYIKKDGKKIFLETTGRNLLHDTAVNGIILNSQDITTRKKAEKEERMRSRMQSLSENSLDMIIRLNTAEQFFYANPVVENFLGLKPIEIMNKRIRELEIPEVFINYFVNTITEIKTKPLKTNTEITINYTKEDVQYECIMNMDAIPEFSENENELETILFVGHDITEAKRIEREIQDKNKKIEDSINYAQRIQTSILPNNKTIRETFPKSFIFYKPRDVVSGDFPWFFIKGDYAFISAVDCTGHGVPGALLSFIGYFILNNTVDHDETLSAARILDNVHHQVRTTLNQDKPDAKARDGMDIAFCKINLKTKELQYSGAHRSLYHLRNGELNEYKGNRKAIGGIPNIKKPEKNFTNYVVDLQEGDKIFFFSDGISDQIGGNNFEKYSTKRIKDVILEHPNNSMSQFNNFFAKDLKEWMGNNKQIDDILLIGIEF